MAKCMLVPAATRVVVDKPARYVLELSQAERDMLTLLLAHIGGVGYLRDQMNNVLAALEEGGPGWSALRAELGGYNVPVLAGGGLIWVAGLRKLPSWE